jgi:TolB-like protein
MEKPDARAPVVVPEVPPEKPASKKVSRPVIPPEVKQVAPQVEKPEESRLVIPPAQETEKPAEHIAIVHEEKVPLPDEKPLEVPEKLPELIPPPADSPEDPKEEVAIIAPEEIVTPYGAMPLKVPEELPELSPSPHTISQEAIEEAAIITPEEKTETPAGKIPDQLAMLPKEDVIVPEEGPTAIFPDLPIKQYEKGIALLPFDNLTEDTKAVTDIMPLINSLLEGRGYEVVDEHATADFLCREDLRTTTHLPRDAARKAGRSLKVKTILAGTVFSYSRGDNPKIGVSARLIDAASGQIIWADYTSHTGEDFKTVLGLGKITSVTKLAPRVLRRLFLSFTSEPEPASTESMYRVAVLPFKNLSKDRNAGMIVSHLFLVQLFKHELFEPVEYGDIRKAMVDLRVRRKGELRYEHANGLSSLLGAGAILTGTVEDFSEGVAQTYPPSVAISARLLDGRNNKIVWFNTHKLDGEDKITAFDWGKMRAPDIVAHAVVSELVNSMKTARWQ